MMVDYKEIEEQHYNGKAQTTKKSRFSYSDYVLKKSAEFYFKLLHEKLDIGKNLEILDYGCGGGDKHFQFAQTKNHIIGIDISGKSIEVANNEAKRQELNAEYLVMDCENMNFADDTFDIILDFGTFSSLNMSSALPELIRVLRKDGSIICIETYGHNPIMNLKRMLNAAFGKRTKWAAQHIMKKPGWNMLAENFGSFNIYYFHFLVLFLPVILKVLPKSAGNQILSFFDKADTKILRTKFLQFLAFKTVAVLSNPKK